MSAIRLMLCHNDQYGNPTEKLQMVTIDVLGEFAMKLETIDMNPRKIRFNDRLIYYNNTTVKYTDMTEMVGNVFWNMYKTLDIYALGFIRVLQLSKSWTCTEGWAVPFEKFNSGEVITGKDFYLDEDTQPEFFDMNQLTMNL